MKENFLKKLGIEAPALLVAFRMHLDWREGVGSPDKNAVTTEIFRGLLSAVLASDEIFVRQSRCDGYFNESFYIFELLDESRAQTAVAVVAQAIQHHVCGGKDFFVGVCGASGEPIHASSFGEQINAIDHCENAGNAQVEIDRIRGELLKRKIDEHEGGEGWKKESNS